MFAFAVISPRKKHHSIDADDGNATQRSLIAVLSLPQKKNNYYG
jgi:hypothetical protein